MTEIDSAAKEYKKTCTAEIRDEAELAFRSGARYLLELLRTKIREHVVGFRHSASSLEYTKITSGCVLWSDIEKIFSEDV